MPGDVASNRYSPFFNSLNVALDFELEGILTSEGGEVYDPIFHYSLENNRSNKGLAINLFFFSIETPEIVDITFSKSYIIKQVIMY
ncbi:hypothetical protein GCM10022392_25210 [Mucilaginibacter panaciglaebae]|uniref:Uncharacterized protein n=1 Tax=Mucilaginibacter panaciglaebae TaxID=502331 RepID=A0ABP7WYY8_9SPHI